MKMKKFGTFQRVFALLLCAVLLLPLIPAPILVSAAEAGTAGMDNAKTVVDQVRSLYSGGTKSNSLELDCGNGLTGNGEKSYMTIVTGTKASHFSNFQQSLKEAGYTVRSEHTLASNSSDHNSFGDYTSPDGSCRVYTYFLPDYKETRIIVDTEAATVEGFVYESQTGKTVEPKLVQWGLSMAPNGSGSTDRVNWGSLTVLLMPDNSLFIHDGGDVQQWNDEACDAFLAFCRDLTGTSEGEKMVINTWFMSHAHHDHFRGFYRFLYRHHDKFDMKNVMYNIDTERSGENYDITGLLKLILEAYPDVRYYNPHTGESININGVTLDVIYTLEDRFVPNSSNKLIIDDENLQGGTYRDGMYKNSSTKTYDFNDTSTVIRLTFPNGVNTILYADATRAKSIYTTYFPTSALKTDIMMVPHHGHNEHTELVNYADAKVYLYTQHKGAAYGPDGDVTTIDMHRHYNSSVRTKFLTMFPGMNVPKGTTPDVDYQVFWAGTETVTIDINKLANTTNAYTSTDYYTTEPAQDFDYTGWLETDACDKPYTEMLISATEQLVEDPLALTTTTIRFNPVAAGALKDNGRYIIKHKQMGTVMYYDAIAQKTGTPNKASSLWPTTESPVNPAATDIFYENDKGIYLEHSNRAQTMWILNQEDTATDATLTTGPLEAMFGGKAYGEVWLNKGNATEWDSSGNKTEGRNGVYWNGIYGKDSNDPVTQFRFLDPRYDDAGWVTTSAPTGTDSSNPKKRYVIEDLGNGDFVVYWRSVSGATMGFLTCDEAGNWGVKKFTDDTSDEYPSVPKAGSTELEALKLNFYVYKVFTDIKSVQFTGSKTFNVRQGTTQAQLISILQDHILVNDTTRRGLRVPCNGTTAQIGSCYLKLNKTFNSADVGSYEVQVLFRNDDNTDTLINTLTVNVRDNTCLEQGHSYDAVVTAPTCTTVGYTTYTCSVCGTYYIANEVAALGHSYEAVVTVPTCTTNGVTTHTCTVCGDSYLSDEMAALGHSYEPIVTAPTCTAAGATVYTCAACGDSYVTDEIAALGHQYQTVITTAPGCESAGTKTFTCEVCGDVYTEPLAATGHSYEAVVSAPTCTADGYTTYTCPCGHSYVSDVIAAPGHSYDTVTVDVTCTSDGSITKTCTVCGDIQVEVLPATGHDYKTVITAASCTEAGYTTHTCANCGDSYVTDETAAFGHSYETLVVAPDCTGAGYTEHTCVNCEDSYITNEVAALGHSYQAVITTAPGCDSAGTKTFTCKNCGDVYTEPLAATGHNYDAVVTAPTCTAEGYTTYTCPCGHSYVGNTVAALGHSFSGSKCIVCGTVATELITAVVNQTRSLYSGGTKSNALELDCGNGMTGNGEKSYMTIVTGTSATHFSNYQKSLKNAGYVVRSERTITSNSSKPNSFGDYISPDGTCRVYTYFLPDYSETRIIVDTHEDIVEGFIYEPQEGVKVEPKMAMFGMSMSEIGYGFNELVSPTQAKKLNCGGMFILRMPDNSLFIHDGGDYRQFDDATCDDLLALCRELTGTKEGEKMVVNTWFLSHAHRDHYHGFYRFINKYHDQFDIKNVMYNIDKERTGVNFDITGLVGLLADVYPEVRYYKYHTGEIFNIAGVQIDIMYTLEDRFVPNSSNKLIIDTDNKGGTYRDGMYKDSSTKTYDFNDTSTVIRVTFENGVNSIWYADATRAKSIFTKIYPTSYFKTDIMMLPHHGHNSHPELVEYANAKVYLYTQHKNAVYGPDNDVSTLDMYGTYRENVRNHFIAMFPDMYVPAGTEKVDYDMFWAGNETVVFDINTLGKVIKGTSKETYYTARPANTCEYTGWGMTDLSSEPKKPTDIVVSIGDAAEETVVATTTTNRYNPVASGALKENGRYIIKHKQMNTVMSYDAVALSEGRPSQAISFWPVTQSTVDPTRLDIFYENDKGIYLDHSNRALGIWILHQEDTASGGALVTGPLTAMFGGKAYGEVWLNKGNVTEWDANGNQTAGRNGVYWNAIHGNDANDPETQYRFLDPRYADEQWVKTSEPTGDDATDAKKRYVIEDLGNGDFLIYWRSVSGATMGFLTCDELGNWGVKMFTDDNSDFYPSVPKSGSAALEALKLNLYQYTNFTDLKNVKFSGPTTYNVVQDATEAEIVSVIQESILLNDSTRHDLRVPFNGTSAKIGYGYLKFNKTFEAGKAGSYMVQVLFRNDDNTDTQVATLTVNVEEDPCAAGHSYETVILDATCTDEGSVTAVCTGCGDTQVQIIPATGHSYEATIIAPTCTAGGYTSFACSACNDSYVADLTPALGHNYVKGSCINCGEEDPDFVEYFLFGYINGADYGCESDWQNMGQYKFDEHGSLTVTFKQDSYVAVKETDNRNWYMAQSYVTGTEATLFNTNTGAGEKMFIPAHKQITFALVDNSDGTLNLSYTAQDCVHDYAEGIRTDPTCTEDGSLVSTCRLCDYVNVKVLYATGHYYDVKVTAPTCTEAGYTSHCCTTCGDSYVTDEVAALGHSYQEGVCTTCGDRIPITVTLNVPATDTSDAYTETVTYGYGTTVALSKPADYEGHIFKGYADAEGNLVAAAPYFEYTFTENTTLYAQYVRAYQVTIGTFTPNGISPDVTYDYLEVGKDYVLALDVPEGAYVRYASMTTEGSSAVVELFPADNVITIAADQITADITVRYQLAVDWLIYSNGAVLREEYVGIHDYVTDEYYKHWMTYGYPVDLDNLQGLEYVYEKPGYVFVGVNTDPDGNGKDISAFASEATRNEVFYMVWQPCEHSFGEDHICTVCGIDECAVLGHVFQMGVCTTCGEKDPNFAFYLVGYINGADYGCEADYMNMGQYKFVDGQLVVTFTQDSYVFLKTEGNADWFMTWAYSTSTSVTFYNTKGGSYEKMFVPGNVEITFTLVDNGDGTLNLSYTTPTCNHEYATVRTEPTCTEAGYTTYICDCGDKFVANEVPALGHSFTDGICGTCGEADPDYVKPVVIPTLTLKAPALEFKDMIKVIAFFTVDNTESVVEMGMITYTEKVDVVDINTAAHVIPGADYEESSARYFASSQGIHAKYLGDTVYLACYAKLTDGSYVYTKLAPYSPITYATNQLKNSTNTELKQLVAAMLNYGAAAQNYFGYNTDVLANSTLTDEQKALPEAYRTDMVASVPAANAAKQGIFANNQGFSVRKPAVSFEGAFSINYWFTPAYTPVDGITLYYWTEADFNAADVLTVDNATGAIDMVIDNNQYRADIEGIAAKDLAKAVYVAAVYSDGTTTWTSGVLGYSIGAYCSSQATKGGTMADLAMATAVYGYHAKAYFG